MNPRLTKEQVQDIIAYMEGHKWYGAMAAIAKKHGCGQYTISRIMLGELYRKYQGDRCEQRKHYDTAAR